MTAAPDVIVVGEPLVALLAIGAAPLADVDSFSRHITGAEANVAARKGFEVAVLEIRIDGKGAGSGSMAAAARVRPDGDGGVLLDDFAEELITLSNVARKPS